MPSVPSMSIECAQQDIVLEAQRILNGSSLLGLHNKDNKTPFMSVSQDQNI